MPPAAGAHQDAPWLDFQWRQTGRHAGLSYLNGSACIAQKPSHIMKSEIPLLSAIQQLLDAR